MGFCLFEDAQSAGLFLAVNCAHVKEYSEVGEKDGRPVSKLEFTASLKRDGEDQTIEIIGTSDEIADLLDEGAKIGLQKVHLNLHNKLSQRPVPLLINRPSRIMVVRELMPEEFMSENNSILTASILFYEDGNTRFISERPGRFVKLTNQGGQTPILQIKE
ncbi:MAG: hypothetical protein ACLFR0_08810 [Alphaproteobacteria bacterium]